VTSLLRIEINLNAGTLLQNVAVIEVFLDIFFTRQFPEPSYPGPRWEGPPCTKLGRITLFWIFFSTLQFPSQATMGQGGKVHRAPCWEGSHSSFHEPRIHALHWTLFVPWTTLFTFLRHTSPNLSARGRICICHGILSWGHGEREEYIGGAHWQEIWVEHRPIEADGDQWRWLIAVARGCGC
jgi:hypothetical protein